MLTRCVTLPRHFSLMSKWFSSSVHTLDTKDKYSRRLISSGTAMLPVYLLAGTGSHPSSPHLIAGYKPTFKKVDATYCIEYVTSLRWVHILREKKHLVFCSLYEIHNKNVNASMYSKHHSSLTLLFRKCVIKHTVLEILVMSQMQSPLPQTASYSPCCKLYSFLFLLFCRFQ